MVQITVLEGSRGAYVIMPCIKGEAQAVQARASALLGWRPGIMEVAVDDWNGQLSPWPAPAVPRSFGPFSGGGPAFLKTMMDQLGDEACHIAGYSLAGLFSIYAGLEWPQIRNVASASGSLWFPGFRTWAEERLDRLEGLPGFRTWAEERLDRLEGLYISLGDREARTGNPVLSRGQSESGALYERALALGLRTSFILEKGGHFNEAQNRLARAVAWLLDE